MSIMSVLELIGVITFSASGAYQAMQKEMDLFGVYILAITTAVGGGIIRDVVMNMGVPAFFTSSTMLITSLTATTVTILIRRHVKFNTAIIMLDALGLGAFAVDAGIKAMQQGYTFSGFLFISLITGVGGGILRDLLSGRLPVVFHRDVYAVAALLGVVLQWFFTPLLGVQLCAYLSVLVIFTVRTVCYLYKVNLPVIKINR